MPSTGVSLPVLMIKNVTAKKRDILGRLKGDENKMTKEKFRANMIAYALGMAKTLCEITQSDEVKLEPEQVRKNASTILFILTETEDFLAEFQNNCSSSI